jgi:hypothetical protein
LKSYAYLNQLGGSVIWDFVEYIDQWEAPLGDNSHLNIDAFNEYDTLFSEPQSINFFEDFEDGNWSEWDFYTFTTGLHGDVTDPYISNGRLFITTHDQQQTSLTQGDESWSEYTLEADVRLEESLDDAGKAISISFYSSNIHYSPEGYISRDSYGLYISDRNKLWQLGRGYQTESATPSDILSSGSTDFSLGTNYHLKIIVQGNRIIVYYNEVGSSETLLTDVNVTNNALAGGKIGFGCGDSVVSIDNISVTFN